MKQSKKMMTDSYVLLDDGKAELISPNFRFLFSIEGLPNDKIKLSLDDFKLFVGRLTKDSTVILNEGSLSISNDSGFQAFKCSEHNIDVSYQSDIKNRIENEAECLKVNWSEILKFFKQVKSFLPQSKMIKLSEDAQVSWFNGIQISCNHIRATNNLVYIKKDLNGVLSRDIDLNISVQCMVLIESIGVPNSTHIIDGSLLLTYDDGVITIELKKGWPDTSFLDIKAMSATMVTITNEFIDALLQIKPFIENDVVYLSKDTAKNSIIRFSNYAERGFPTIIPDLHEPTPFSYDAIVKLKKFYKFIGYINGALVIKCYSLTCIISEYK